jgi:hypothetical protein
LVTLKIFPLSPVVEAGKLQGEPVMAVAEWKSKQCVNTELEAVVADIDIGWRVAQVILGVGLDANGMR